MLMTLQGVYEKSLGTPPPSLGPQSLPVDQTNRS
jgi:hypothetical protein